VGIVIVYAPELPPAMPERQPPLDRAETLQAFAELAYRLTEREWLALRVGCTYARRGDA
jgi:hypothetical protein